MFWEFTKVRVWKSVKRDGKIGGKSTVIYDRIELLLKVSADMFQIWKYRKEGKYGKYIKFYWAVSPVEKNI